MKDTEQRIRTIIHDMLDVPEEDITPDARFVEDFGADSLELMELIMAFEDEFNQEIPDDDAQELRTVGDAYAYVRTRTAGQQN